MLSLRNEELVNIYAGAVVTAPGFFLLVKFLKVTAKILDSIINYARSKF